MYTAHCTLHSLRTTKNATRGPVNYASRNGCLSCPGMEARKISERNGPRNDKEFDPLSVCARPLKPEAAETGSPVKSSPKYLLATQRIRMMTSQTVMGPPQGDRDRRCQRRECCSVIGFQSWSPPSLLLRFRHHSRVVERPFDRTTPRP